MCQCPSTSIWSPLLTFYLVPPHLADSVYKLPLDLISLTIARRCVCDGEANITAEWVRSHNWLCVQWSLPAVLGRPLQYRLSSQVWPHARQVSWFLVLFVWEPLLSMLRAYSCLWIQESPLAMPRGHLGYWIQSQDSWLPARQVSSKSSNTHWSSEASILCPVLFIHLLT